jgi:hypothetical protein
MELVGSPPSANYLSPDSASPDLLLNESADSDPQFAKCHRSQHRRNTDFSQADNDLKRFLSEREQKRRDSDVEESLPTYFNK